MPDADFLCWGDPLLDNPPDLTSSPPNLTLRPAFTSYDEMPIAEADLWLFTSAWEGMPTILIELAIRGVPLVASQVGGVPELADEDTSFPVFDVDDPDAYVHAICFALENPGLRTERSRRLQERAIARHSEEAYVAKLKEVFDVGV
jgi:glycosyltransferase involved in cell wall biosynthesis